MHLYCILYFGTVLSETRLTHGHPDGYTHNARRPHHTQTTHRPHTDHTHLASGILNTASMSLPLPLLMPPKHILSLPALTRRSVSLRDISGIRKLGCARRLCLSFFYLRFDAHYVRDDICQMAVCPDRRPYAKRASARCSVYPSAMLLLASNGAAGAETTPRPSTPSLKTLHSSRHSPRSAIDPTAMATHSDPSGNAVGGNRRSESLQALCLGASTRHRCTGTERQTDTSTS